MFGPDSLIGAAIGLIANFDAELIDVVLLSLRVSLTATGIAFVLGAALGIALVLYRFPAHTAVLVAVNALLGLPPVVAGLVVYLLISRSGPLGPLGLLFTPTAMVIAQTLLATPIVTALVHRHCAGLWDEFGDALVVDGATRPRAAITLLAIGQAGLVTAYLTAFGRAVAEVGAILVVGGNIRGYTRTMTTSIALETSKGDLPHALGLGLILIALTVTVTAAIFALNRSKVAPARA
jgi:tungstate transport system permease protein